MAVWPYSNIVWGDGDTTLSAGQPSVTLTIDNNETGYLMLLMTATPSVQTPTGWTATAIANVLIVDASDDNYATLFYRVSDGTETAVTVTGNDTDPQDGLSASLVVLRSAALVDATATGNGGNSTFTSPSVTVVSGNTELIWCFTQINVDANPAGVNSNVYTYPDATAVANNEVQGIRLLVRRVGQGASGGTSITPNGTVEKVAVASVNLPYPGRTIRRIDFT